MDIELAGWEDTKQGIQNLKYHRQRETLSTCVCIHLIFFQTKQRSFNYMQPICVYFLGNIIMIVTVAGFVGVKAKRQLL